MPEATSLSQREEGGEVVSSDTDRPVTHTQRDCHVKHKQMATHEWPSMEIK